MSINLGIECIFKIVLVKTTKLITLLLKTCPRKNYKINYIAIEDIVALIRQCWTIAYIVVILDNKKIRK